MRRYLYAVAVTAVVFAGPTSAVAGDRETANQIAANLENSGQLKNYSVSVKYHDGAALLRGTVASDQQKAVALLIARRSAGVATVIDEIAVAGQEQAGNAAQSPALGEMLRQGQTTSANKQALALRQQSSLAANGAGYESQQAVGAAAAQGLQGSYANATPLPIGAYPAAQARYVQQAGGPGMNSFVAAAGAGAAAARFDQPHLPNYAWPAYAAHPNYAAVTYPKQYSPTAWPYIGPFYPYPQVPLGWRKVTLEWDDGWWMLDFKAKRHAP